MSTVLIVDDDADICELIAFKLAQVGHDVETESDGEGALAAARELHPDLILLDWMMPKLTGVEVCQRLNADPSTAGIPVVMLTAKAQESDVQRGFAAGAVDYLVKPFSPRELATRVAAILARADRTAAVSARE